MTQEQKFLKKLVLFTIFVVFVAVGMGAFTRLVDAGLGCPDWPGCYGHLLWPDSAEEINRANEAWSHAPVETDKTWPEMVHRYFASSVGLFAIIILFYTVRKREKLPITPMLPAIILGAVILQGLFGMWTVTLKLWPQVVTAHLLGGFTVLSLFWLLFLKLKPRDEAVSELSQDTAMKINKLKPLLVVALIFVVGQIALGGWTTSNYAAVACPDLPTCQHQWWPNMDFAQGFNITQHIGPNYLGGKMDNEARIAIHMSHRIGAILVTLSLIFVGLLALKTRVREIKIKVFVMWGVLALQIALGLSNIIFNFPVGVAVAHNLIGATLLLKLISLVHVVHRSAKQ